MGIFPPEKEQQKIYLSSIYSGSLIRGSHGIGLYVSTL